MLIMFKLNYGKLLQGTFKAGNYNLAFVFQVNCPGCFFYGIPVFNTLYNQFSDKINFIGISTAFEYFKYNTLENTKKLLLNGELVG